MQLDSVPVSVSVSVSVSCSRRALSHVPNPTASYGSAPTRTVFGPTKTRGANEIAAVLARELDATLQYRGAAARLLEEHLRAGACDVIIGVPVGLGGVRTTTPYYRAGFVFSPAVWAVLLSCSARACSPFASWRSPRATSTRGSAETTGAMGLPDHARTAARSRPFAAAWHVLTMPFVALVLHAAVRCGWHVPAASDGALANETIHAVQHLSFFLTALLFWWTLFHGRYARLGYGIGVAYVFFTLLHSGFLAAVLSFADEPLYAHGERAARLGFDALADQQRAGLVMWVPAGIIMTAIGLAILAAWLGHSARRMAQSRHPSLR